jgi:hypothetical protein
MKVYIAIDQDYEDYRIIGVYSDEETAWRDGNARRNLCDWDAEQFYEYKWFRVIVSELDNPDVESSNGD